MGKIDTKDLNQAFKAKWRETVERKADLFEIESKIVELHNSLVNNRPKEENGDFGEDKNQASGLEKRPLDLTILPFEDSKKESKKSRLSKESIKILKEWFLENIKNPYPK